MRTWALTLLIFLSLSAFGQQASSDKSCLIVKMHKHSFGENMMRWTVAKPFNYVEGEFPKGIKFHYEMGDSLIREIKEKGGKVVVLNSEYGLPELEDARKSCKEFQADSERQNQDCN